MKYYVQFSDRYYSWCVLSDTDDLNGKLIKSGFLTKKSANDYIKDHLNKGSK